MLTYLARRVTFAVGMVAAISFASFWILAAHINPLWPLLFANPPRVALVHKLTVRNHLDKPIPERYVLWLKGVFTGGDGRRTILKDLPIWHPVLQGLAHTAELAAGGLIVALVLSIGLGLVASTRAGHVSDRVLRTLAYLTWSMPVFVTAAILQWVAFDAGLAADRRFSGGLPSGSGFGYLTSWYEHMALPIAAVALSFVGLYSRYIRSGMLVTLNAPYSVVARAKGLPERRVFLRHALRNALIPFFAVVTIDFGSLVGATLVVDVVFGIQGLGTLFVDAISGADPFQLEAVVIVTVLVVVVLTFLADAVYPLLDPRIRLR